MFKKPLCNLKYIFGLSILAVSLNCSQDPVSSIIKSDPSSVSFNITVDKTNLDKLESKSLAKPTIISRVMVSVTATDMDSISRQLTKVGTNYSANVEVPKGTNRIFRVAAYDSSNFVQYAGTTTQNIQADQESVNLTLTPQYPEPVVVSLVHTTNNSVSLFWTRNDDEDFYAYLILVSEIPQPAVETDVLISIDDQTQTTFTDVGLSANTTYYYQVLVVDTELLYHASNIISATTQSGTASAFINDIWVDHNYQGYDVNGFLKNGMLLHFDFNINGQQGKTCLLTCWFYYAFSNTPLHDFNTRYYDTAGNVAVQGSFVPAYSASNFSNYTLFMPYDELHMDPGTSDLRFTSGIFDSNGILVAYENADFDQYFIFMQTANSIQTLPKTRKK
jgi:hypothetical protein